MSQIADHLVALRTSIRLNHFCMITEKTYVAWAERFFLFHEKKQPDEMSIPEIKAYLSHLAVDRKVSPSIQKQALTAMLYLFVNVLKKDVKDDLKAMYIALMNSEKRERRLLRRFSPQ